MLQIRIIPSLLLKNTGLVKTVKFKNPTYIGDPINAVKIFNEKEVDEIIFLDITKTVENKEPNFELINEISNECFIPFAYGGGVNDLKTMKLLFKLGVEKVILNTAAFYNKKLITQAANMFGSQSIVVSVDYKKNMFGKNKVFVESGSKNTNISPIDFAIEMERLGAGELSINSIDRDGTRKGYDIETIANICSVVKVPVIASGGANDLNDMKLLVEKAKVSAVAAGSMFVYYGKMFGVLINYPDRKEILKTLKIN